MSRGQRRPDTMPAERPVGSAGGDSRRAEPIFIHGILPRSGTNFLWDLLLLHPDCASAIEPVHEDLFLEHSDHLVAFIEAVHDAWDPSWGEFGPELPRRLRAALGDGLLSFLWADHDRRLVSKSPSVRHLGRIFEFFPRARVLILVRDGRSVTQSCMDTFGWEFERAARAWAQGADEIQRFRQTQAHRADGWRLVRYEDLLDDLDRELTAVLDFAGLDAADYDLEAARNLPVRGSSTYFGPGRSTVNWQPAPKDASFAPKERWRSWSPGQRERFEWLAGEQLRAFGYPSHAVPLDRSGSTRQRLRDLRWGTRQAARDARKRVGTVSRPLRRRLGRA